MTKLSEVPQDLSCFLLWLKDRTESAWKTYSMPNLEQFEAEQVGGTSWRIGTEWLAGLTPHEVAKIEKKWGLRFPAEYRKFLATLNAPDRGKYCVGWSDDPPFGLTEEEDEPSFYNWRTDDQRIADALAWPLEGLLFDVAENALWPHGWGEKPINDILVREKVTSLLSDAPKLIPLIGHRYLVGNSIATGFPVVSVWKSDIVFYGSNLQNFLLLELADLLQIDRFEIFEAANQNLTEELTASIPFWGELMLLD